MTREEINEIEQYCSDHKIGKKARLAELGIPFWNFYRARRKYQREDELIGSDPSAGNFIQLARLPSCPALQPSKRMIRQKSRKDGWIMTGAPSVTRTTATGMKKFVRCWRPVTACILQKEKSMSISCGCAITTGLSILSIMPWNEKFLMPEVGVSCDWLYGDMELIRNGS